MPPRRPRSSRRSMPTGTHRGRIAINNRGLLSIDPVPRVRHRDEGGLQRLPEAAARRLGLPVRLRDAGAVGRRPIAAERPFHSLSYPDINYTVMRPAALPPSASRPRWTPSAVETRASTRTHVAYPATRRDGTPSRYSRAGIRLGPGGQESVPVRQEQPGAAAADPPARLFQIPDTTPALAYAPATAGDPGPPPIPASPERFQTEPSNASLTGDPYVNDAGPRQPAITNLAATPFLDPGHAGHRPSAAPVLPHRVAAEGHEPDDRPDAPVRRLGHRRLLRGDPAGEPATGVATDPDLAYDILGEEIGLRAGRNVRHRSFFIVDRTKLIGRTPSAQDQLQQRRALSQADPVTPGSPAALRCGEDRRPGPGPAGPLEMPCTAAMSAG